MRSGGCVGETLEDTLFALGKRYQLLEEGAQVRGNVCVQAFGGLLVEFARAQGATVIVKAS